MSEVRPEKVLVTGASGFIGSATVKRLAELGIPVVATARSPSDQLVQELGVPITKLDVMEALPDFEGVRTVVHAASPNDIYSKESHGGLPLSVMGTRALIEHAAQKGVDRFIFLSTIQVYGTELHGKVDETTPHKSETIYGLNHYLGEEVCRHYAISRGLDVVSLRPANVYGVPSVSTVDRWTLVPMTFIRNAREDGKVTLRSSGRQLRNFVSMDEVTDVIVRAIEDFPKGYSVVNAGSHWHSSIVDIAKMMVRVWEREMGDPLEIDIQSVEPKFSNSFDFQSTVFPSSMSKEQSQQKMEDVIADLIELTQSK